MERVRLRMFAAARVASGRGEDAFDPGEVPRIADLLDHACARYGEEFAAVLATSRIWLNGDEPEAGLESRLTAGDEVAILPPVSGGT